MTFYKKQEKSKFQPAHLSVGTIVELEVLDGLDKVQPKYVGKQYYVKSLRRTTPGEYTAELREGSFIPKGTGFCDAFFPSLHGTVVHISIDWITKILKPGYGHSAINDGDQGVQRHGKYVPRRSHDKFVRSLKMGYYAGHEFTKEPGDKNRDRSLRSHYASYMLTEIVMKHFVQTYGRDYGVYFAATWCVEDLGNQTFWKGDRDYCVFAPKKRVDRWLQQNLGRYLERVKTLRVREQTEEMKAMERSMNNPFNIDSITEFDFDGTAEGGLITPTPEAVAEIDLRSSPENKSVVVTITAERKTPLEERMKDRADILETKEVVLESPYVDPEEFAATLLTQSAPTIVFDDEDSIFPQQRKALVDLLTSGQQKQFDHMVKADALLEVQAKPSALTLLREPPKFDPEQSAQLDEYLATLSIGERETLEQKIYTSVDNFLKTYTPKVPGYEMEFDPETKVMTITIDTRFFPIHLRNHND